MQILERGDALPPHGGRRGGPADDDRGQENPRLVDKPGIKKTAQESWPPFHKQVGQTPPPQFGQQALQAFAPLRSVVGPDFTSEFFQNPESGGRGIRPHDHQHGRLPG